MYQKKKKIAIVSISAFNSPPVLLLLLFYSYGPYSHIQVVIFITQIRYSCDEMHPKDPNRFYRAGRTFLLVLSQHPVSVALFH